MVPLNSIRSWKTVIFLIFVMTSVSHAENSTHDGKAIVLAHPKEVGIGHLFLSA